MAATTSVVLYDPQDTSPEVHTIAGFLAGYSGRTREAYTLDLRMFYRWCDERSLGLFDLTRTHIELYARDLEDIGRKPATIGRRLSTVTSFYRYAAEEGVIEHSPAVHIRRPRLDYESHAVGLDRNELGAFLVAAGLSSPRDHGLCSLLALNGLRISEALNAQIELLGSSAVTERLWCTARAARPSPSRSRRARRGHSIWRSVNGSRVRCSSGPAATR
ncbi:MAG: tyrosine-type recombinase/integrase [Acidimicrobiales bacterium]